MENGCAYYKRNHGVDGELFIKDTDGIRRRITRLQPDESEKGLDLQIPSDGPLSNQVTNITEKNK